MRKLFLFIFLVQSIQADFSALLLRIEHNDLFHFSHNGIAFSCRPAQLLSLTKLFNMKHLNSSCKDEINSFVKQYPFIPYQAELILHEEQKYLIKPLKEYCFIMLNAGESYTHYMIENGYGMLPKRVDTTIDGTALHQSLQLSQKRAEYHKKGIWNYPALLNCFAQE